MNTAQKKITRRYINAIKYIFPTFYPKKKNIISELKQSLNYYYQEHPDFTIEELYDEFGSPQEYVSIIISNTSEKDLLQNIKMKRRTAFILSLILTFVLGVGITSTILILKITSHFATHYTTEIVEEETHIPTN